MGLDAKERDKDYGAATFAAFKGDMDSDRCSFRLHKLLPSSPDGRHPCLDVVRILCIWLVVVDHAGTPFGVWNVMYVQAWVLQYLFMICGISFGLTSKSLAGVLLRLGGICCAGTFFNGIAWAILGLDWRHEIFNVVFQFWFVVGLMVFLILLAPLKANLQRTVQRLEAGVPAMHADSPFADLSIPSVLLILSGGYYLLTLVVQLMVIPFFQHYTAASLAVLVNNKLGSAAEFWNMPTTTPDAKIFIEDFLTYMQLSLSNLYLVYVFPILSSKVELVGWLIILNTYLHKMLCYRAQEARLLNSFDCTMLGLVCFYYGLSQRQRIGTYICRYWFVFLFVCALLWPTGTNGRFDEHPPTDLLTRARDNALEMLFIILFLTAVERIADEKIFRVDHLDFLNIWALTLFMVHKAVHMLAPQPLNWFVLFALAIPFYLDSRKQPAKGAAAAAAPEWTGDREHGY